MSTNELSTSSSHTGAWITFALSLLYTFSPIDILPDVIPVVGWVDDLVIAATGTLNLIQKTCQESMSWLSGIAKMLKWVTIILGGIAVLILALLGTAIYSLVSK